MECQNHYLPIIEKGIHEFVIDLSRGNFISIDASLLWSNCYLTHLLTDIVPHFYKITLLMSSFFLCSTAVRQALGPRLYPLV